MTEFFICTAVFLSQPADPTVVNGCDRLVATCSVAGAEVENINFLFEGNMLTNDSTTTITVLEDSLISPPVLTGTLTIDPVTSENAGIYSCQAVTTTVSESRDFTVMVFTQEGTYTHIIYINLECSYGYFLPADTK